MPELNAETQRNNTRLLYIELAWMGFAFAMEWYYLQVYLIRLNPDHPNLETLLGLLVGGRALVLAIGAALANRWQSRFRNAVRAISAPMFWARFVLYLGIAFVPSLPIDAKSEVLVALVLISSIPLGIAQGIFLGMMPYAVSKDRLAKVVSNRSVIMNGTVLICMVIVGQMLERLPRPMNYQVGFVLSFFVSAMSWWNVHRVTIPDVSPTKQIAKRTNVWSYAPFRRFAIVTLAVNTSVFMAGPLVQLHLVRGLNASDTWISVLGVIEMAAGAGLMLVMDPLIKRFGTRRLMIVTALMTLVQPAMLGLTPVIPPYIIGVLLFGAGWFAINVLMYNRLVEIVPPDDLRQYAATYQILINGSLFIGPLIGTFLIENVMTVPAALVFIAVTRLIASLLVWGIRTDPEQPAPQSPQPQPAVEGAHS